MKTSKPRPVYSRYETSVGSHYEFTGYQSASEVDPCETCGRDSHETRDCPLTADRFIDPGEC